MQEICQMRLINKFYSFTNLRPASKLLAYMIREGKIKKYMLVIHQIFSLLYENFLFTVNTNYLIQTYKFYVELRAYLFTNHKFYNLNILMNWYVLSLLPMFDVQVSKTIGTPRNNTKLINIKYKYIFRDKRYNVSLKWIADEIQSKNAFKLYNKVLLVFFDNILNFKFSTLHKKKIYIYKRLLAKKKLLQ